ncbi:RHS domain-containing protein, partial [Neisseria canis]
RYDADNQLTEARIEQEGRRSEHWHYRYDALGRRVSKQNAHNQTETRFLWEGSRLLQEYGDKATYTYVYTEQGSYEPLAQIVQTANRDGGKADRQILYYHNDQIGIPREMTDAEGNIVWRGEYGGWGKLNNAERECEPERRRASTVPIAEPVCGCRDGSALQLLPLLRSALRAVYAAGSDRVVGRG